MYTNLDIECVSINSRVQFLEVGVGWNDASFEDQNGLDQPRDAGAAFEMTDIRFQCATDHVNQYFDIKGVDRVESENELTGQLTKEGEELRQRIAGSLGLYATGAR